MEEPFFQVMGLFGVIGTQGVVRNLNVAGSASTAPGAGGDRRHRLAGRHEQRHGLAGEQVRHGSSRRSWHKLRARHLDSRGVGGR
ncbi:hypothetical protein QF000_001510 [Paraburkholderia atlantica]|uniref:hypothetical protein n=1 Tax=Paraburkholderia atlantica TaxID=2654982 RepID=UPI003D230DEB